LLPKADTKRRGPGLRARPTPFGALLAGLAILAACGGGNHEATGKGATTTTVAPGLAGNITVAPGLAGNIIVLADVSLTDSFNEIGKDFEAANPSVNVKFSYDVSSTLATKLNSGAAGDVFASAGNANMLKVTAAGNAPRPQTFVKVAADGVAHPESQDIVATYPIAVLRQSPHPDVARAFLDYVLSPPGQATLAKYGFVPAK